MPTIHEMRILYESNGQSIANVTSHHPFVPPVVGDEISFPTHNYVYTVKRRRLELVDGPVIWSIFVG